MKFAIGCANNGTVTWCSPAYPGCTSDRAIVQYSGILPHLRTGDLVMADKGFLIADLFPPGVSLNIPSFLDMPQLTSEQRRLNPEKHHEDVCPSKESMYD